MENVKSSQLTIRFHSIWKFAIDVYAIVNNKWTMWSYYLEEKWTSSILIKIWLVNWKIKCLSAQIDQNYYYLTISSHNAVIIIDTSIIWYLTDFQEKIAPIIWPIMLPNFLYLILSLRNVNNVLQYMSANLSTFNVHHTLWQRRKRKL